MARMLNPAGDCCFERYDSAISSCFLPEYWLVQEGYLSPADTLA
jgi:hypothetical protein